jgi:hypothetical protein
LAIVIKGGSVIAYYCDGKVEAWLWGQAQGNTMSLKNKNGETLDGVRGGGRISGSVTAGGSSRAFSIAAVTKPSGAYRSTATIQGATVVSGWVVLPDGSQVGVSTTQGGGSVPAEPLDPRTGRGTVQGTPVTALPADPDQLPGS